MTAAIEPRPFPRAPLIAAATAITLALLAAFVGRMTGIANSADQTAPLAQMDLRFEDRADGGVNVLDSHDNHVVTVVPPGTNGFLRATVRGLASERKRENVSRDIPFTLTVYTDQRLMLFDPGTGRHIDLEAFGPTNEAAFSQLFTDAGVRL
jgi:putative photosynthetic complex assembly protein